MSSAKVLVTDPVGTVGAAVVDRLLSTDRPDGSGPDDGRSSRAVDRPVVYALLADPDGEVGRDLASRGVRVVRGTPWDRPSLDRAMRGMDGVFLTAPCDRGVQAAIAAGENVVDAAAAAGVAHLVFESTAGTESVPETREHDPNRAVEGYLRELGLPSTVVRPTFAMGQFRSYWSDALDGSIGFPLAKGVRLPMVDVRDVAAVVATVLLNPSRFVGRDLTLAGDQLTLPEVAAEFSLVLGRTVEPVHLPPETADDLFGAEVAAEFRALKAVGRRVDTPALERETGVELRTLKEFLAGAEWANHPSETQER